VTQAQSRALEEFIEAYGPKAGEMGPVKMCEEVFGLTLDRWQRNVLRDYGRGERKIAVRSSHNPGKTATASWCIVHQLLTRFPQKTVATAPTGGQLYDALFAEVKTWMNRLPAPLLPLFIIKSDRIELAAAREESFASFRTARAEVPEALQGIHAPWVLIIADEASGVPEPIFEAASGSMAGEHATTMLFGNPVRTSGTFFNAHHKLKRHWKTYHVHGKQGYPCGIYSPRVAPEYAEEQAEMYGEDSNVYRVRVLGEFPRSDLDTVIPYELVEAAMGRDEVTVDPKAVSVWGVDVAYKGDDLNALCKRKGNMVPEPIRVWLDLDAMKLVGVIKAEWDATAENDRPVEINIDALPHGHAVASRLRELGLPARAISVAETPALSGKHYTNLRTELWYLTKEWLSHRSCLLPRDDELMSDLVSTKYEIVESSGKIQIEPKKKARARGVRSPDRGDALILTFATPAGIALGVGGRFGHRDAIKRDLKDVV
jgi:hypothetical protein